jgi:penicillin amidase
MQQTLSPKRRIAMIRTVITRIMERTPPAQVSTFDPAHISQRAGRIEFVRDANGVAHIYAEVEADLYRAVGYLQGRERLITIEALRHLGSGRLSEFLVNVRIPRGVDHFGGLKVGEIDAFLRPLGFEREAQRDFPLLSEPARRCLQAFSDGMNDALRAYEGNYPAEFLVAGTIRPWTPQDCLLLARASALVVSLMPLENELTFDNIRNQEGDAVARQLYPDAPWQQAPDVAPGGGSGIPDGPLDPPNMGSNNWAVAGSRTASGKPLYCNDPHVPLIPAPTYWHHVHLECPEYRVQGGLYPGYPGMGWGHNGAIAWGVTTAFRDAWDLFRIERLPNDSQRYRTPTGSAPISRHREVHRSRFGKEEVLEWESCDHGILYPDWRHHDGSDLALKFADADLAAHFEGHRALYAAQTVEQTQRALAQLNRGPFDFNMVYAHKDGHIAWEPIGQLPRRKQDGLFIRNASDPNAGWEGYLDFSENPKIINPENGIVVSANSDTDPDQYPLIGTRVHCEPRYRQERITDWLLRSERHDVASMQALQKDVYSGYGAALLKPLCTPLRLANLDAGERTALDYLQQWDGHFSVDSVGACVFFVLRKKLAEQVFMNLLGGPSAKRFTHGQRAIPRLDKLLMDEQDSLRDLIQQTTGRNLDEWIVQAFGKTVIKLRRALGDDPADWQWGNYHRVRIGTVLGDIPGLRKGWLALEGPMPGENNTVSPSVSIPDGKKLRAFVGASTRFICDLAHPEEAWFSHCAGPSADPATPYFQSLSEQWLAFGYFKSALWKAEDVPGVIERYVLDAPLN